MNPAVVVSGVAVVAFQLFVALPFASHDKYERYEIVNTMKVMQFKSYLNYEKTMNIIKLSKL